MKRFIPGAVAFVLFVVLSALWIVSDRRASQRIYDRYSAANTSTNGLSLAAAYLGKQRKVSLLTQPIARAPLEKNAVVFRVVDSVPLRFDPESLDSKQSGPPKPRHNPLLSEGEEGFVRAGGRMVIAAPSGTAPSADVKESVAKKVFPIWPSLGDVAVCRCAKGFTALGPRMHAIYAAGTLVIVARERLGAGELFLVSAPDLFRNDELASGDHLGLLGALAGANRPVYFDEVAHGIVSGDGPLALLKEWRLGPFLILVAGVTLLVFWRAGRRVGPPEDDYREVRSDAVDLVRSLAALYHDVTADGDAIRLYHDALTRTIASQSGLRGDALRKRVDELTGSLVLPPRSGKVPAAIFARDLNVINEAFQKAHRAKR